MADESMEKKLCPDCGKVAMFESSGITICGACGQFGGKPIEDFEALVDQHIAEAKTKTATPKAEFEAANGDEADQNHPQLP